MTQPLSPALVCASERMADYLAETEEVDFGHPLVEQVAVSLFSGPLSETEAARRAFEYVRDRIAHSWDIRNRTVTRKASEVLRHGHGICYAKSNLLAALLRRQGIAAGFCYQKLTLGDTPDTGYCVHALNAVYLAEAGRWIRLDARGNKPGVEAAFAVAEEKLAFPARAACGELDYPTIYASPHPKTTAALMRHDDCLDMYLHHLPVEL